MTDASFHDADPAPLALGVADTEDLQVVAALLQDAILSAGDTSYDPKRRQFALLLNRFRWEDAEAARREMRPYERVRSVLVISDALRVGSDGIDPKDADLVLELLGITWQPGEDGTGTVQLQFAGDGTIAVAAESLNMDLRDVTQPYIAPSGQMPQHPE